MITEYCKEEFLIDVLSQLSHTTYYVEVIICNTARDKIPNLSQTKVKFKYPAFLASTSISHYIASCHI